MQVQLIPSSSFNFLSQIKLQKNILDCLNIHQLKNMRLTCAALNMLVKSYLEDESVWHRLLMEHFFVDRALEEKSYSVTFKTFFGYLRKMRSSMVPDQSDFDTIINELFATYSNAEESSSHLTGLLQTFGYTRKPFTIEYFVERCILLLCASEKCLSCISLN